MEFSWTTIRGLLGIICPSAIGWMGLFLTFIAMAAPIAAFVINAVNTISSAWLFAHICKKGRRVVTPAGAHSDSATSIVHITRIRRIFTTLNNVAPRIVFRRSGQSMSGHPVGNRLSVQASTRMAFTTRQNGLNQRFGFSALASNIPHAIRLAASCLQSSPNRLRFAGYGESAKDLIRQIDRRYFSARHGVIIT